MVVISRWVAAVSLAVGACGSDERPGLHQGDARDASPDLASDAADAAEDAIPDGAADGAHDAASDGAGEIAADGTADALGAGERCSSDAACASGHCLYTRGGKQCAAACVAGTCSPERECRQVGGDAICVDPFVALCMPCREHGECNVGLAAGLDEAGDANLCLAGTTAATLGGGRFCGVACGDGGHACPAGYDCREGQCRPTDDLCPCYPIALELGADTACSVSDGDHTCTGARRCDVAGEAPTACDAPAPAPETCNGKDDDCDGLTDERPLGCGAYACRGGSGCATSCAADADCAPGLGCDTADLDGDGVTDECLATGAAGSPCGDDAECESDYCGGGHCCARGTGRPPTCCAEDLDCSFLDGDATCAVVAPGGCSGRKTVGRCQDAVCAEVVVPAPEACLGQVCQDGQCLSSGLFEGPHLCDQGGACTPTADLACNDGEACTFDSCSGADGCLTTPRNGAIEARCYTFDEATRGVGACQDGFVTCTQGLPDGCIGERGPSPETCNGVDDDCDQATDEDTGIACFPYLCAGTGGCRTSCTSDGDCVAGNFCDAGACVGTGEDGAACEDDGECRSGHCQAGVCCAAGLCCRADADCASLDAALCQVAGADGCAGTRVTGVCGEGAMCTSEAAADATVCTGEICAAGICDGATRVAEGICEGAACLRGPSEACTPYACVEATCLSQCAVDADCTGGASCRNGACVSLPDGSACERSEQCAAGRCDNGYCCKAPGTCCGDDSACAALDVPASCRDPATCDGVQTVGQCAVDFTCHAVEMAAPEACLGATCGPSSCFNLEGGELVLEGLTRHVCGAQGACAETSRDCRDNEATSYCTRSSSLFVTCQGCTPDRATCIVFDNPCYCE